MKRWFWLTVLILLIAVAVPPGAARAQDGGSPVYTIEGTVDVLDDMFIVVSGEVTDVEGEDGMFSVGEEVIVTVAPAGSFLPALLDVGDEVRLSGILLSDGETIQATDLELLEEAEDEDGDDMEEGEEGEEDEDDVSDSCVDVDPHPVGEALAEKYDEDYATIMAWFCDDGFGFGEIMLAEQIAVESDDITAQELLDRKAAGEGWGEIMLDLGMVPGQFASSLGVGRPEHAGPPEGVGKPDDVGPPEGAGKPDDAGPPDHIGPPEDAGPPEGVGPRGR